MSEQITMDQSQQPATSISLFTDFDIALFQAGRHYKLYEKFGAHQVNHSGTEGVYFAVWAPNAKYVSVIGDFNGWERELNPMQLRWDHSGIWECFVPNLTVGQLYKYFIDSNSGYQVEKADPFAFMSEVSPYTASRTTDLSYQWTDAIWEAKKAEEQPLNKPISIYELHLGSWKRKDQEPNSYLSYRELADELPAYCQYMNFTHVEFMPIAEHPFYGSWGYQITGFYAPTSRYGTPQDLMYLIDQLHQAGIGVILDWVPSHFPTDEHGLGYFDGTHLYEHADPRKGFHPDWKSYIFNSGRNEVRAFLISNAFFWLEKFHADALRVDAVASMLYLDYSRKEGEWIPNAFGGRENLENIQFLQDFNEAVHGSFQGVFTVAEESTAYPGVTADVSKGGLGFDLKWMMGWMHDTLSYFQEDPIYRRYHHNKMTFSSMYAFAEKFVLPLSHDEVVHGKKSLLNKMPGDRWQQYANLRLLFGYMFGHPGAKMIFMGGEFGQDHEWRHDWSLDWHENEDPHNSGVQMLLKTLNDLYKKWPAFYAKNYHSDGFQWVEANDSDRSVLCWLRKGNLPKEQLLFVANFTPTVYHNYRVGVPNRGFYTEILNTDASLFGGSGLENEPELETAPIPYHGFTHSLSLTLPPLGLIVLHHLKDYDYYE